MTSVIPETRPQVVPKELQPEMIVGPQVVPKESQPEMIVGPPAELSVPFNFNALQNRVESIEKIIT